MANARAERTAAEIGTRRTFGAARNPRAVLPRQIPPDAIARDYARAIFRIIDRVEQQMAPILAMVPEMIETARNERRDAGEGRRVRELIRALAPVISTAEIESIAILFATRTSTFQRIQLNKQVQSGLGIDLFISDRRVPVLVDGFVSENTALIEDVPRELKGRLERTITRAIASGTPRSDLARQLESDFGFSRNRARLIARDQTGKLYGQINVARQQDLGVESFIWRTVGDRRVRPDHVALDGEKFRFDQPPSEGLPGEPIQCRCYAEPVFDGILGEV